VLPPIRKLNELPAVLSVTGASLPRKIFLKIPIHILLILEIN
jgi:hypothetical protein